MQKKMIPILSVLTLTAFLSTEAVAGLKKIKAKGEAPYSMGAVAHVRRAAVEDAKKSAVRKYASHFDSSRFRIFEKALPQVDAGIDSYVVEYEILEGKNKTTKQYEVMIEATIDETRIELLITSVSGEMAGSSDLEAPYITFLLVAREAESIKTFKDKVTDIEQKTTSVAAEERTTVEGEGLALDSHEEEIKAVTTGGSIERKSAQERYRVFMVTDADAAVNEVFTKAGYENVDPRDAEIDIQAFLDEYSIGDDITATTRSSALNQCKGLTISFFAIGHMDVGPPEKDSATGMDRVYVKVSAKVTDLKGRLPRTLASVRGIQYAGIGSNPQVARQNALNTAATRMAKDLVDQLRAKGVRTN